jgi:hypothetical protein
MRAAMRSSASQGLTFVKECAKAPPAAECGGERVSRAIVAWLMVGGAIVGLSTVPTPVSAQDLEAGKPPQALFSANCSACHKTPQGLAHGRNVSSFLQTHYTTGSQSASALAAYLLSVGDPPPPPPSAAGRRRGEPAAAAAARAPEPAAPRPPDARPARLDERLPDFTRPGQATAAQPTAAVGGRSGAEPGEAGQGRERERERPQRGPVRVAGDPAAVTIAITPLAVEQPPSRSGTAASETGAASPRRQRLRPAATPQAAVPAEQPTGQTAASPRRQRLRPAATPQAAAPADQPTGQTAAPRRRPAGRRPQAQRPVPPG